MTGPLAGDGSILARWPGRCPACAGPIRRGDLITRIADQWCHDDCDRVVLPPTDEADAEQDPDEEGWPR